MVQLRSWPGKPYPLGATWTGDGVNFALFSQHATAVDVCLFESIDDPHEAIRVRMAECTDHVWHVFIPNLKPGQLYGYRVYGPYDPEKGLRFNASKLLLDPYARAITGEVVWGTEMFAYENGNEQEDLARDYGDNAWAMPKSVVIDPTFDWENDKAPNIPMSESVIYEMHVEGFTKLCPNIPENLRGTYAGLSHPAAIEYLKNLGITAVELLPVHHFIQDQHLLEKNLKNYWGYNSIGYFAPHAAYGSATQGGDVVKEFKTMVKSLHAAGIEVILDVVYNHTAEGNQLGPTLSFKGIDNPAYYWLSPETQRFYMDFTGCGNSLNVVHPQTIQLITDSLRYWVNEMHVDGFRFDLAATLVRGEECINHNSSFLAAVHQDPVLSRTKLIAEPWDIGEGGYLVGNFPPGWGEWNGKYRDLVRKYWKGDEGQVGELAFRLSGSSDLYLASGKNPYDSINFITSHDGFTLNDLVSYNEKHNEANGENNQDGDNNNSSWNCGAEGPTNDVAIDTLRERQKRNFLATLFLSQGVPMLVAGDEFGRTQNGNNNAYCQANETSWLNWNHEKKSEKLLSFTRALIKLRREHPIFRRPKFFYGRRIRGKEMKDIMWFHNDGTEMTDELWHTAHIKHLGMLLSGHSNEVRDAQGETVSDDTFLVLFNAFHEPIDFKLPGNPEISAWELIIDTTEDVGFVQPTRIHRAGETLKLTERSLALLRLAEGKEL